ncbi:MULTISPECIES: cation transporter [Sphingomonadaceae]|jgi:Co/Zn/Cd efflux system component|uniref:Co/Zn/Cd efflux system component n=1 Tax=Sphingobium yanoikuyae TaxID=13690 RepID=A0A084E8I7_SPHYA|nr:MULTISPECIES: cation transporter [Sphingomonadaceae]KEZ14279.1 Co/Zn/Cd efflux system component [Sphingobium yanoikuyae]MDG5973189.1 cation transporter [Sphingomonas paucimobilis]MDK8186620.1 cation transporter [Sphingomonas zeae]MDK8216285.1 cation transporter [Sphingomonas sp. UMB7805-LC452B]HJO65034.1 cation transporter [Sphingomonas sanguinis]|tara:strand:+ start:166 stop:786 length:621 start_codon:yes stop_codon:yes gene_type:complete
MAGGCCGASQDNSFKIEDASWRRVLWVPLAINGGMFCIEIVAGVSAGSASLKADALDFLGDTANYAISLGVAGLALYWRSRAALAKGTTLLLLGLWVIGNTLWMATRGTLPAAGTMGGVGVLALLANLICAVILWRHRTGDANRRSVWICSRNDAIGNVAVVAAAWGVFGTGTAWPDVGVAVILAGLGVSGGWQIIRQARREMSLS